MMMKKFFLALIVAGLTFVSDAVLAGYTTYTSNTGYHQPHGEYVPYYHANTQYEYQDNTHHDYDIRYDIDYHYNSNRTHYQTNQNNQNNHNTYHIVADDVDIENNYYNRTYGPYRNTATYPIYHLDHVLPAQQECRTQTFQPRNDDYFAEIGLRIPAQVARITKYRIRRSDGRWSRRYVPGDNDTKDNARYRYRVRMRSYFGTHEHQYVTCDYRIATTYRQQNNYYNTRLTRGTISSNMRTLSSSQRKPIKRSSDFQRGRYTEYKPHKRTEQDAELVPFEDSKDPGDREGGWLIYELR